MRRNSAKIGAELPKGVKPDGLPSEFTQQISELADYVYSKMKDQILLVNEMRSNLAFSTISPLGLPCSWARSRFSQRLASRLQKSRSLLLFALAARLRH